MPGSASSHTGAGGPDRTTLLDRLLAVPLVGKLVGANTLILLVAVFVLARSGESSLEVLLTVAALIVAFAVNVLLVWVALRPLAGLETMATHVQHGDFDARVPDSRIADRDLTRIGETLNHLVDRLTGDRARMRELATQVVKAQDEERARVARELHDSTAQTLAAVLLQIRVLTTTVKDPAMEEKLETIRDTVADALEDVRTMAHTMYPRILDDLGLGAAVEWLATRSQDASGVDVQVQRDENGTSVPATVASVLYRVAQESLNHALTHSGANHVAIRLRVSDREARLEVRDDGRGFDPARVDRRRAGMGLFAMRERAALVDGSFEIDSAPGRGTRVLATVPIGR